MIVSWQQGRNFVGRSYKKWTGYEKDFLERNAHLPLGDLAYLLDRSISGVSEKFTVLGIHRKQKDQKTLTQQDKEFIISNYSSTTLAGLGSSLNKCRKAIQKFLVSQRLLREREDRVPFFKRECCQNYAYILGWLFSDGTANRKNGHLKLSISYEDGQYILPYMNNIYHWSTDIIRQNDPVRQPLLNFTCFSKDVVNFLCDEWEFDQKSHFLSNNFVDYLLDAGDECVRCFLRGFFEGDGCALKPNLAGHITKRYTYDWTNFSKLIPLNLNHSYYKYFNKRGAVPGGSRLRIFGDFFQYIYNTEFDAALPRKKNIVLAHFEKPYYRDKYGPLMEEV